MQIPQRTDSDAVNLALDTIRIGKQTIVFNNSKPSAEKTAEDIAKANGIQPLLSGLADQALHALSRPTKQCERLAYCIRRGVAFHHAGLAQKQKDLIEQAFRDGYIKAISATPTLAMGVDLPAFRTILKDMRRYGPNGMSYIPILEYFQMAGRAGRPRYDSHGEAIMVASTEPEKERLYERYIMGEPEEIYSKLAIEPVLRTYILSLVAGDFTRTRSQIMDFFNKTFWAHQFEDMHGLESKIERMLQLLTVFDFLEKEDFMDASRFNNERYRATALGKRVAELYIDPLTANNLIIGLKRSEGVMLVPFSFLHLISYTLEMRPLLKVKVKDFDYVEEANARFSSSMLVLPPSAFDIEYEEFLASVKTAIFLLDWIEENDEQFILDKYGVRPGELKAKLDHADWLLYACLELAKMLGLRKQAAEASKMRLRLKYGVKEELLPLLRLKGIGRIRARKLFNAGFKDLGDIKTADISRLSILLGPSVASDVKDQLGQGISQVDEKKKGQTGLKLYVSN